MLTAYLNRAYTCLASGRPDLSLAYLKSALGLANQEHKAIVPIILRAMNYARRAS